MVTVCCPVFRLLRVERGGAYSHLALRGEFAHSLLNERDRALCNELVYGTLARRGQIDHCLAAMAARPLKKLDPRALEAMRLAAYQLLFL